MGKIKSVAIDGPAGAGKSTVAKAVAERMGFLYIDTGAMYRAIALKAIRNKTNLEDETAMGETAATSTIDFDRSGTKIFLDEEDVSAAIRTPEVTAKTKFSARAKPVREILIKKQQEMSRRRPVVMEGRDITTIVLSDAAWKILLSASPQERARRRVKEMIEAGHEVDENEVLKAIEERDASDREVGPLKIATEIAERGNGGIMLLDTTGLSPEEVVNRIVGYIESNPV